MSLQLFNLTNQQIIYIYHDYKTLVENHEAVIKTGNILGPVRFGMAILMQPRPMTMEELARMKNDPIYRINKSIVITLEPLIKMLQESDPEMVEKYGNQIFTKKTDTV
jgi:hypothetical protein